MRLPIRALGIACLLTSCSCAIRTPSSTMPVIRVHSVDTFIAAIGSNRVIELDPGTYVLSEAFEKQISNPSVSITTDYVDAELHILGVSNLTIRGASRGETKILTQPTFGNVLVFDFGGRIVLENLVLGHGPEPGFCTGGVLKFQTCRDVTIRNCRLFGSGTEGIFAERTDVLRVRKTTIEQCSYNILSLSECTDVTFEDCRFSNNQSQVGGFINLYASSDVRFTRSVIDNNRSGLSAYLFETTEMKSPVRISGCRITDNEVIDWCNDSAACVVSDSRLENNRLPEEMDYHAE